MIRATMRILGGDETALTGDAACSDSLELAGPKAKVKLTTDSEHGIGVEASALYGGKLSFTHPGEQGSFCILTIVRGEEGRTSEKELWWFNPSKPIAGLSSRKNWLAGLQAALKAAQGAEPSPADILRHILALDEKAATGS